MVSKSLHIGTKQFSSRVYKSHDRNTLMKPITDGWKCLLTVTEEKWASCFYWNYSHEGSFPWICETSLKHMIRHRNDVKGCEPVTIWMFLWVGFSHIISLCPRPSTTLTLTIADAVVFVLGRLGAAAALRHLLLISSQQGFNLRGNLSLIHGWTPLLVLQENST